MPAGPVDDEVILLKPKGPDPWPHRRGEPRAFAVFWILFLLGSTIVSLGPAWSMGAPSYETYRPAASTLMVLCAVGLVVLWPMVRLSQAAPRHPLRAIIGDLIVLLLPLAAVVLPQAFPFMTGWPIEVAGAVMLILTGWAFAVAGVLLVALSREAVGGGARWAAMAVIIAAALAAPVVEMLRPRTPPAERAMDAPRPAALASPLSAVWEITRDRSWSGQAARLLPAHETAVVWTLAGGAVLFSAGLVAAVARRRGPA